MSGACVAGASLICQVRASGACRLVADNRANRQSATSPSGLLQLIKGATLAISVDEMPVPKTNPQSSAVGSRPVLGVGAGATLHRIDGSDTAGPDDQEQRAGDGGAPLGKPKQSSTACSPRSSARMGVAAGTSPPPLREGERSRAMPELPDFWMAIDTPFRLDGGHALRLVEARPIGERRASMARDPFRLEFLGPVDPVLLQRTHRLEHDALGAFDIFLVPIGQDAGGTSYEAIFA